MWESAIYSVRSVIYLYEETISNPSTYIKIIINQFYRINVVIIISSTERDMDSWLCTTDYFTSVKTREEGGNLTKIGASKSVKTVGKIFEFYVFRSFKITPTIKFMIFEFTLISFIHKGRNGQNTELCFSKPRAC